jgi:hypothetical protein
MQLHYRGTQLHKQLKNNLVTLQQQSVISQTSLSQFIAIVRNSTTLGKKLRHIGKGNL